MLSTYQELFNPPFHYEQQRTASLQTSLDRLQDNFSVLAAARNDERLAFEEKIGQNEVLVEMLRKNHEQKQNELRIAINERDLLKARLEELGNDYESYKSRARYVLEQRAQSSNEQVNQSIDFNAANDAISDLKRTLQLLRFAHDEALKLARKDRVLREKAESSARSAKAEIVEIYDHMAIVREELFNSRTELKDRNEECAHYQKQISDLEKRVQDENRENLQVIKMLKEDIAKREKVENTLTDEVQNAKKRYQKAMNLLEEWKNLSSRPASTDIPQARFDSVEN
ncbi:unnamed protein product [Cylicostephanus goldi]|uniref:Uncharacterized protein n=1 Tax=Cylicostephanus goldi TaxID=71465 RepID=A0A3P6QRU6_CYLGO|nr:unnamed protein product [Cylicostephanus goldi]